MLVGLPAPLHTATIDIKHKIKKHCRLMGQKASSILCLVKKLRKRKAQTITGNLMRKTAHFYAVLFVFFLLPLKLYSHSLLPICFLSSLSDHSPFRGSGGSRRDSSRKNTGSIPPHVSHISLNLL